jgi:hypothetical protein
LSGARLHRASGLERVVSLAMIAREAKGEKIPQKLAMQMKNG